MTNTAETEYAELLEWLMERARVVDNIRKPETSNSYGRAATAISTLLAREERLKEVLRLYATEGDPYGAAARAALGGEPS
jgi:hypothetical protein